MPHGGTTAAKLAPPAGSVPDQPAHLPRAGLREIVERPGRGVVEAALISAMRCNLGRSRPISASASSTS